MFQPRTQRPFLAGVALAVLLLAGAPLGAQPSSGATQLFDNPRVTAWDVAWKPSTAPARPSPYDTITIALTAGAVKLIKADGSAVEASQAVGDVAFYRASAGVSEAAISGAAPRCIVVELKNAKVASLSNTTTYPNAFPRPGSKRLLENERVVVWDYTWTPGRPTPMHFHDKDVVVTYLAEGVLASTAATGEVVNNPHFFGFTKFNARDRSHTETLVKGLGRAVIVELK